MISDFDRVQKTIHGYLDLVVGLSVRLHPHIQFEARDSGRFAQREGLVASRPNNRREELRRILGIGNLIF